jgi:hypothetical protein
MDPFSTFILTVRIMRKGSRFEGAWVFEWLIDCDTANFKDFVDDISEKYPWGIDETVTVQYLDSSLNMLCLVSSDKEMMTMFKSFGQNRSGDVFITINGPSDKSIIDIPCTPSAPIPSQACFSQISNVNQPLEGGDLADTMVDTYLANPFEHFEHVGVDEEDQYSIGSDTPESDSDDTPDPEYVPGVDEDEDDYGDDSTDDDEDWVTQDAKPDDETPIVAYDKNDPPMNKGTIYPSIEEFRLAIAQYSIKHEFEYKIDKSEPDRFRAHCPKKGCKWRIHASHSADKESIEVTMLLLCVV